MFSGIKKIMKWFRVSDECENCDREIYGES